MESTTSEHLKSIILGLGTYFHPVNALSEQKRMMHHGMSNPRGLNIRRYNACMIGINEYFDVFPGEKASKKIVRQS